MFRKSSHSTTNGDCVEVEFLKSSASTQPAPPGSVRVRDSKAPGGGTLSFTPVAWDRFLGAVREGSL